MVYDANKELPHIDPSNHTLDSIVISCQDVKDVLLHLNATKASGPDLISPRLLREGADILALPYSIIFNRSLDQGYFPSSWKEANVTPIYKKDDKSLPSNYRPISLLSQSAKVMERCVHKYPYNYVISNHILTRCNQALYTATQPLINCYTHTTNFVKRLIMVKRCDLFSVILVRPSTESGTRVCFISFGV